MNTDKIMALVEDALMQVHLETQILRYQMSSVSTTEGVKLLRAFILTELNNRLKPMIQKYVENENGSNH